MNVNVSREACDILGNISTQPLLLELRWTSYSQLDYVLNRTLMAATKQPSAAPPRRTALLPP